MTTLVNTIRRRVIVFPGQVRHLNGRSAMVGLAVAAVSMVPGGWRLALDALSEAYLAVAVFVAGTLALLHVAERGLKTDLGDWLLRHPRWQVPAATALGAFPGCGGAIIAVTQFSRGKLSFGAVVATLTATMGDAMFLLLAREPYTAFVVSGISMAVGMISGHLIDAVHSRDFLRPRGGTLEVDAASNPLGAIPQPLRGAECVWIALMAPGLVVGLLAAFQIDLDAYLRQWTDLAPAHWLGVAGSVTAMAMWAARRDSQPKSDLEQRRVTPDQAPQTGGVIDTTNFITSWVVFAFVGYELLLAASGIDLAAIFETWGPMVPAAAIALGFIPGCGPQIMVTSLYLSGSVPLSAQLGNAIANDGDALFPALAVAPRAALVATLYSAVPAAIVAYAWYALVET